MRVSSVFKNFKPVWKFHTSLKNSNQFKKIQTKEKNFKYNIYMYLYPILLVQSNYTLELEKV